jgi:hypothetical protein
MGDPPAILVDGSGRLAQARVARLWLQHPTVLALHPGTFRVWVMLWSYADPDGTNAFPSVGTLSTCLPASKPESARRAVFRALSQLVEVGLLTKEAPGGGRKTTRYTLQPPSVLPRVGPAPTA